MAATDQGSQARRRFPALDPEPPPRPWWHWAAVAGAVAAVAGVATAAAILWPSSGGTPQPQSGGVRAPFAATGHVLVVTPAGYLALTTPAGAHAQVFTDLGPVPPGVLAAPDNRRLALSDGEAITMSGGRPVVAGRTGAVPTGQLTITSTLPFADQDRALVLLGGEYGPTSSAPVVGLDLATGRQVPLGVGDEIAGDPRALGAFVSVAAPPQASATVPTTGLVADAYLELRDAGNRPVRIATAEAINKMLGQLVTQPVALVPFPDPAGDKVAVVVEPVSGARTGSVVVLDRAGHLLDRVPSTAGPLLGGSLTWSADGRSLAYPATGRSGAELTIWTVGGQLLVGSFPDPTLYYQPCIWSPDGSAVLCGAVDPRNRTTRWAVMTSHGALGAWVRAPGAPVAWLAPAGGGRGTPGTSPQALAASRS